MCTQPAAARVGEYRLIGHPRRLAQPRGKNGSRVLAQRRAALLAPLADDVHMRAGPELHVLAVKAGQFRQTQAGLDREQDQRVVAATGPGALVRRRQQRIDLGATQERHERAVNRLAGMARMRCSCAACEGISNEA